MLDKFIYCKINPYDDEFILYPKLVSRTIMLLSCILNLEKYIFVIRAMYTREL